MCSSDLRLDAAHKDGVHIEPLGQAARHAADPPLVGAHQARAPDGVEEGGRGPGARSLRTGPRWSVLRVRLRVGLRVRLRVGLRVVLRVLWSVLRVGPVGGRIVAHDPMVRPRPRSPRWGESLNPAELWP